ncbi:hypothetical protein BN4901_0346 [Citrobacter europaeus]|uniref:PheST operon leader peptide PheM n=1 Tax=Citrobacter europaeus TaxID=1914243 RepID=A0ABY0JWH6_9ENTR|nr:hypothetical protein CIP106467_4903 [Citrobacter europaeus]SCA74481.1 hypothetical protein BN4901_0346 [Citrobacter europaeus]
MLARSTDLANFYPLAFLISFNPTDFRSTRSIPLFSARKF